jgi:hypothetical protein
MSGLNQEEASKILRVLAELKARKEMLVSKEISKSENTVRPVYKNKLDQVNQSHVNEALKKWNVK